MVALPLAATLFTAIIKWQRNREVNPTAESSWLNSGLNLYGTLKTNGSSSNEINSNTLEENSNSKYNGFFYEYQMMHHEFDAPLSLEDQLQRVNIKKLSTKVDIDQTLFIKYYLSYSRQHQPQFTVFSSKLCVPVPSGVLSTNHQPGCVQHLLNHPRKRLLLPEWHPCSQPVLDHMWTLCTVPRNEQPGYVRQDSLVTCSFSYLHILTLHLLYCR